MFGLCVGSVFLCCAICLSGVSVTHLCFGLLTLLPGGSHGLSVLGSEFLNVSNVANLAGCCLSNLNIRASLSILLFWYILVNGIIFFRRLPSSICSFICRLPSL